MVYAARYCFALSILVLYQQLLLPAAHREETIEQRQAKIYADITHWCNGSITGYNAQREGAIVLIVGRVKRREDKKVLIERALAEGAEIDNCMVPGLFKKTALIDAIVQQDDDIVEFLLNQKADPNLPGVVCARHEHLVGPAVKSKPCAPLLMASSLQYESIIQILKNAGARDGKKHIKKDTCTLL